MRVQVQCSHFRCDAEGFVQLDADDIYVPPDRPLVRAEFSLDTAMLDLPEGWRFDDNTIGTLCPEHA